MRHAAPPVLIVGGGIGGLAAAIALARRGIASHVLERRDGFEQDGAGIQIGPNGSRILDEFGVLEILRPLAGTPEAIDVRTSIDGKTLARLPLGQWIETRHGSPYIVAHRQHLHGALLKRAGEYDAITISTDIKIVQIEEDDEHVAARCVNAGVFEGCALIGADGIWSQTRARIGLTSSPVALGKSAARTVISASDLPDGISNRDVTLWLSPQGHIVHYPVRGGDQIALVVIGADREVSRDWNASVRRDWVRQRTSHCARPVATLLSRGENWRKWALRQQPIAPYFHRGRIALLGDAAHPVLPFLAQGAVLALEDAVVLAECLANGGDDVRGALDEYEKLRLPRAAKIAQASQRNGRIYHLSGPMAAARNMTLRHVPSERLMAQYDWVYGWKN